MVGRAPVARVLVVDDEEIVREVMLDTLARAGFEPVGARHGAEALARLEWDHVDLILSDVSMPVMDGYALYEAVRARPEWISTPFVFLTALGQQVRIRYAKELGVDDYLVKPVSAEDLLVSVRALLRRRERIEQAGAAHVAHVKETILTMLAHELRTPLTCVSGYAELLRDAARGDEAERLGVLADGMLKGVERLCRLAQDLFLLVELRSGEASRAFERGRQVVEDLRPVLWEALASREQEAARRRVELVQDLHGPLPPVLGDPRLLSDAVLRLIDNGIKFSKPEGGRVTLRARAEAESLVVSVEDEGVGIPAAELERISDLFYQVDRAVHEQQGTGSGLTLARAIVLMHGGTLAARSEPGVGSEFTLTLPVAVREGGRPAPPPAA